MNRTLLLSFDIEEFDLPEEYGSQAPDELKYGIPGDGTTRLLDLLDNFPEVKATFFTTGNFARRFPETVKRMSAAGHEVGSHGMDHSRFRAADLAESKQVLEEIAGTNVTSFRMARLAPVEKNDILAAGYNCESSLNPVWLPGRYNHFGAPLTAFREPCGLWQIPVSAVPAVRFPLFWLSFKNLPGGLYRGLAKIALFQTGVFNLYTHPWEYDARARDTAWKIPGYITRHAGEVMLTRLEALIRTLGKHGEFRTFAAYTDALNAGTAFATH